MKNDIIGHESRKAAAIESGVCENLVQALTLSTKSRGKSRASNENRDTQRRSSAASIDTLSEEDQLRLQAVFIANSLANAGSAYIAPLVTGGIIPPLLTTLLPENSPPRLVVECLRTLVTITSTLRNDPIDAYRELNDVVSNYVVDPQSPTLELLARMLQSDWNGLKMKTNDQFLLSLQLVHFIADGNEKRQKILVSAGILDLLAFNFASWVAGNQRIFRSNDPELLAEFPYAPSRSSYPHLVRAITSIIGNSAYRTSRFLTCKDMLIVFPESSKMPLNSEGSQQNPTEFQEHQVGSRRWDRFLPRIYSQQVQSESSKSSFPTLPSSRQQTSILADPLAWMIHMARSTVDEERVVTLWLLATVLKAANLNIRYEKHIARLVVPLLTQGIAGDGLKMKAPKLPLHGLFEAISALKLTVANSKALQTAANEAKALEHLCLIIKKTFDPVPKGSRATMWSPQPGVKHGEERAMDNPNLLGPPGFRQETAYALFIRASAMSALASLAEQEDKYRRAIIESGVMQSVVDSVSPRTQPIEETSTHTDDSSQKHFYPNIVLISAMELLVTLSRSVGLLRTSLIDAKVALPVLELARHKDINIKLYATDALTNMLLHFSPMKEDMIKEGVHILLSEYAHSSNMTLRISALWALKHLVLQVDNRIKIEILEQLGPGFIMNLLNGESPSQKRHLAIANVRGEKVDILNEEPEMEIDGPLPSSDDELVGPNDHGGFIGSTIRNELGPPPQYLVALRPLKDLEQSATAQARRDDIRVQHHVLDVIRNMLAEPTDQHPALVDQVLNLLGAPRFFDVVISKFKPKPYSAPTPHSNGGGTTSGKQPRLTTIPSQMGHIISSPPTYIDAEQYAHPDIIKSASFLLAHIANGRPSHKNLVISQPNLLNFMLPHFLHPDAKVRIGCLWIICNVLWVENAADTKAGRARATDLRRGGIEDRCRELLGDGSLDVQERAKYVGEAFTKLLGQQPSATRSWD